MKPNIPKILCVDDEPLNLKLLDKLLVSNNYEVIKAEDGESALKAIEKNAVDLVLLDVMMPKIDGFEVCRRIKGNERFRTIPVVMLTALAAKEERIKGIEAGAEDFISKPIDQGEVLARVKMLLKMKTMNDRLHHAYEKINNMTTFGEASISSFDPLNFSFLSKVDAIVNQIIRKTADALDKPQLVIVGLPDEHQTWQWYQYEYMLNTLNRTLLNVAFPQCLRATGNSKIIFYNENDLDHAECQVCIKILASLSITVSNMACYSSEALTIFTSNYGREITHYDASALNNLVMQSLFMKSLADQIRETESAFEYTVSALARASEVNDEDTGNHILRVGEYCALLAGKLGLPDKFVSTIRLQALMHDVGKIHIPPDILKKPGKFTDEEFAQIKQHPLYGAKILGSHPRLTMAAEIALSHHERWDGGGYPNHLTGEQIPLAARIMNLADQYDAMRNARCYKPAFDHATTCGIIIEGDGRTMPSHFDPQALAAFKESASEFEAIYERLKG
ncbi:MAG TPA: two-component system response regulator [Desulfobulbaceae bacterium]|nr:MAG: two-component system response regulator [Deltaproteobacteria bacterium RIFOXYD12_FULL_53_23]HCC54299.1 two-component system response regulator [Desulfobulbaceae bacterium]